MKKKMYRCTQDGLDGSQRADCLRQSNISLLKMAKDGWNKLKKKTKEHKWHELTHRATGEEGGPSAHGVDVTLWRQTCGPTVTHVQNERKRQGSKLYAMFLASLATIKWEVWCTFHLRVSGLSTTEKNFQFPFLARCNENLYFYLNSYSRCPFGNQMAKLVLLSLTDRFI